MHRLMPIIQIIYQNKLKMNTGKYTQILVGDVIVHLTLFANTLKSRNQIKFDLFCFGVFLTEHYKVLMKNLMLSVLEISY